MSETMLFALLGICKILIRYSFIMIDLDFLSKLFPSDNEVLFVAKEGTTSSEDLCSVSSLKVDSNNFDVSIKKATDGALSYSLFINKGYSIEDVDFSMTIDSERIAIKTITKKSNMSGRLEIVSPSKIQKFQVDVINGDIGIDDIPISHAEFQAINGDINLHVIDDVYHFILEATNGDTNNSLKNNTKSEKSIHCSTVNGDINIAKHI